MRRSIPAVCLCSILLSSTLIGQNRFVAVVTDSATTEPLPGVNVLVAGTDVGAATDAHGRASVTSVPNGLQTLVFSYLGYRTVRLPLEFPLSSDKEPIRIRLAPTDLAMAEVTVTTTRTSYHLDNVPVRIEVKGKEDIGETMIDHPANISELFLESTGIQVQQTSAVLNYLSIKLQGLDGSYTQILKDGFPLYGGLSAGLSVTQIPPLDLASVEVIKGPSSSLYGGGAIAGIINLISQRPDPRGSLTILVNGTSSRGIDAGTFYSKQGDRLGTTMLANANLTAAYDADHTTFSDIPKQRLLTVNPKIFWDLSNHTKLIFGISSASEDIWGGDMTAIAEGASLLHPYLQRTRSNRTYSQFELSTASQGASLNIKNSVGYFFLNSSLGPDRFQGTQWMSYSEAFAQLKLGNHAVTGGLDLVTDTFAEDSAFSGTDRSYKLTTIGLFVQDDWHVVPPLTLETGLRIDAEKKAGIELLPRIAGMYRITPQLGFRASFGSGYKIPTVFSEQSDPNLLYRLAPANSDLNVEHSLGGEIDLSYSTVAFNVLSIVLDQAFFYTRVNNPLVVVPVIPSGGGSLALDNAAGYLFSRGAETDLKLSSDDIEAFIGYTYADAEKRFASSRGELFLTPPHRFVLDVVADAEEVGRIGAELRFTSRQLLHNGTRSPSFWVMDLLFQKKLSRLSLFLGVENLFNFEEQRYTPVVTGSALSPQFNDIWAPVEGRIVNAGFRLSL